MTKRFWLEFAAGFLLILAVSCANDQQPLSGTSWTLVGMNLSGQFETVGTEISVTIKFAGDGNSLSGFTGCNSYRGTYEVEGASFRVVDLEKTEAGCPTDELFKREAGYVKALLSADNFGIREAVLDITTLDGPQLAFELVAWD